MIYGLGHPRCGTAYTAGLLKANGIDVGHEFIGSQGIISWEIASLRPELPWGDPVTFFEKDSKKFLVARSPLAALNSVVIECLQTRSIGFRAAVIYENLGLDIFAQHRQRTPEIQHDYMTWSVLSLVHWYEICFSRGVDLVFRVDVESDDLKLSEYLNHRITREKHDIPRNHKPFQLHGYPVGELEQQDRERLIALADLSENLGYPEDADRLSAMANAATI